eukprot:gene25710-66745_t
MPSPGRADSVSEPAATTAWRVATPAAAHRVRAAPSPRAAVVAELPQGAEVRVGALRTAAAGGVWARVWGGWSLQRAAGGA